MRLNLPHTFSVFAVDSDLGRPGDVYVFVPSPHMTSVVCLEPRMFRALASVMLSLYRTDGGNQQQEPNFVPIDSVEPNATLW